MSKFRYDGRVVAYHGTTKKVGKQILEGGSFRASANGHDWIGDGTYFWENGPERAWQWARKHHPRSPFVVGAVIHLGNCYDLTDTRYTDDLSAGAAHYFRSIVGAGLPVPANTGGRRMLDCSVINWWLKLQAEKGVQFDSVRCAFTEGPPVFEGSAICMESHIQIAVRNPECIVGVFRPWP